ncbi:MAG: sigma-54 dependent transcriptional regulator [Proteobacteria bacterium]|jgi:two-component system response regulator AtoC|nr:sigma-54 dependent transcriptional regulator [Pseudomonadota bacterium]
MKRLLVVDDEESIRVSLCALLARHGYHTAAARGAREALELLASDDIDVAFVDVRMPEMDGIDLTREIIARGIRTTIIVMSAYGSVNNAIEALKAGAYDYVTKPFKTDEVILTLAKAEEREGLRRENARLKAEAVVRSKVGGMVASSEAMARVFKMISKVAEVRSTVLVMGESGTGKELVARAIHNASARAGGPFVAVNCGAIPETLLESELYGFRRGAFTDAHADKRGLFSEADGGTLLLDEIGELPMSLQVKLLRTLQEGTIRRLGDTKDEKIDVRVIAATLRDLEEDARTGRFREDLYYRLNVLPIRIPPLRERREDIPLLVTHFVERVNARLGTAIEGATPEAEKMLLAYEWPGNVRELENVVERAVVLTEGSCITPADLPDRIQETRDVIHATLASGELSVKKTVRIIEEELIRRALVKTQGNRTKAAEVLEISHRALLYKIKQYGIS